MPVPGGSPSEAGFPAHVRRRRGSCFFPTSRSLSAAPGLGLRRCVPALCSSVMVRVPRGSHASLQLGVTLAGEILLIQVLPPSTSFMSEYFSSPTSRSALSRSTCYSSLLLPWGSVTPAMQVPKYRFMLRKTRSVHVCPSRLLNPASTFCFSLSTYY